MSLSLLASALLLGTLQGNRSRQDDFDDIYASHKWGTTLSGPGSTLDGSTNARNMILATMGRLCKLQPHGSCHLQMLDAACGDMTWMPLVLEQAMREGIAVSYTGADVSEVVLRINRANTALQSRLESATRSHDFIHLDLAVDSLPQTYDLVVARHVLMHLSNAEITSVLRGIRRSSSR